MITSPSEQRNWHVLVLFSSIVAGFLIGNLVNILAPLVVDALHSEANLSLISAGWVTSAEFTAIALTAFLVGPRINRLSKKKAAIIGCVIAITFHLVTIAVTFSLPLLLVVRFMAGIGAGLTMAAAGAAVAAMSSPDRIFALVKVLNAVASALAVAVAGVFIAKFGLAGCFGVLALSCLLLLPVLFGLPAERDDWSAGLGVGHHRQRMPHFLTGCMAIGGLIFWMTSASLGWPFIARLGTQTGLPVHEVGGILSMSIVIGVCGGLLAAWQNLWLGRVAAIFFGTSLCGTAWLLIGHAEAKPMYVAGVIANSIAFYYTIPYILGMSAAIDKKGRWAAIATSSLLVGMSIAPPLGGWILETRGSGVLGIIIAVTQFGAFLIMAVVGRRVKSSTMEHGGKVEEMLEPSKFRI